MCSSDLILSGAFNGDFDVALERFAAFCRVIALGQERTQDIPSLAVRHADQRIPRLSRTANELDAAAKAWRIGALD